MRTTIELPNYLRAKLLEIAAQRGEKGFSGLVKEAVEGYIAVLEAKADARRRAIAALGSLSSDEADALERATATIRTTWR